MLLIKLIKDFNMEISFKPDMVTIDTDEWHAYPRVNSPAKKVELIRTLRERVLKVVDDMCNWYIEHKGGVDKAVFKLLDGHELACGYGPDDSGSILLIIQVDEPWIGKYQVSFSYYAPGNVGMLYVHRTTSWAKPGENYLIIDPLQLTTKQQRADAFKVWLNEVVAG